MASPSSEHQGGNLTLLSRRAGPKPKLFVAIPRPQHPPPSPQLVGHLEINTALTPDLETGLVYTGTFSNSPVCTAEEERLWDMECLQHSGDAGWNDYLHWHKRHANDAQKRPMMPHDWWGCPSASRGGDHWRPRSPRCSSGDPEARTTLSTVPFTDDAAVDSRERLKEDLKIVFISAVFWLLVREVLLEAYP